jgi:hypothetical protein
MTTSTTHRDCCRKELGHVLVHGTKALGREAAKGEPGDNAPASLHRGVKEVEAESVALIGATYGMDTTVSTVPYVSGWASSVSGQDAITTVKTTAARVREAAVSILDALEAAPAPQGDPPGLDREVLATNRKKTSSRKQTRTKQTAPRRSAPPTPQAEGPAL